MDIEIKLNYEYLIIEDSIKYYGGSQEWYSSFWKRMAGCGPTTAATITMYEQRIKNSRQPHQEKMQACSRSIFS